MLSDIGQKIFKMKYANGDERWEDACLRVAEYVASAERNFGASEEEVNEVTGQFFSLVYSRCFLPGGRIIANAGTDIKNLMNCFTLPVEDSRTGIYGTLLNAAEVFAWGGGVNKNVQPHFVI
jgi:ribonucleoside-diphosphate reductase alpha chain